MENLRLGPPSRLNNDLTLYLFPQNENARRGMANDKYQKMRADLEAEKGKTGILKEQVIKNKSLFSFCAFRLGFVPIFSEYLLCTFAFSDFAKHVAKAKDIIEQSKHIQQLDNENKILKEERKEMLKMHEDSMKALQDSASAEINRLKEELAILKDQKQAADEHNLRHREAFKLLQQEKESLADTVW